MKNMSIGLTADPGEAQMHSQTHSKIAIIEKMSVSTS